MQPKCAIIENVPMALSACEKIFSEEIHNAFKGYVVKAAVLNASEFGVPQIRKRAFIIALRDDLGVRQFEFPKGDFDAVDVGNDTHMKPIKSGTLATPCLRFCPKHWRDTLEV